MEIGTKAHLKNANDGKKLEYRVLFDVAENPTLFEDTTVIVDPKHHVQGFCIEDLLFRFAYLVLLIKDEVSEHR